MTLVSSGDDSAICKAVGGLSPQFSESLQSLKAEQALWCDCLLTHHYPHAFQGEPGVFTGLSLCWQSPALTCVPSAAGATQNLAGSTVSHCFCLVSLQPVSCSF